MSKSKATPADRHFISYERAVHAALRSVSPYAIRLIGSIAGRCAARRPGRLTRLDGKLFTRGGSRHGRYQRVLPLRGRLGEVAGLSDGQGAARQDGQRLGVEGKREHFLTKGSKLVEARLGAGC